MKFKKRLLLLPLMAMSFCLPLSSCKTTQFYEIQSSLGLKIDQNMKKDGVFFNNFAFFGGSDISYNSYDLYENDGYRNQIELFEDYVKYYGPYKVSNEIYENYIYGKRLIFDFSKPNAIVTNALENFEQLTESNKILTTVYNVDTPDVTDLDDSAFSDALKELIDKSLSLQNNTGMIIIKTHYQTNDESLNEKINKNSDAIKDLIATYYSNDIEKLQRIGLVDHSELTKKKTQSGGDVFVEKCLTKDNKLNAYGQLEMLYETISSLYKDNPIDLIETANLSTTNILYKWPTHSLSAYNSYVTSQNDVTTSTTTPSTSQDPSTTPISPTDKVKNFQEYLSSLTSAKWQFFGDSLTYAGYQTWGYKGYVEYLRWILKNEFNRENDLFLNQGVPGATILINSNKPGEYSFPQLSFVNYDTDILYVSIGTNDVVNHQTSASTYMATNIEQIYTDFKQTNENGWMIVSTIPYFYSTVATMNTIVDNANSSIKTFAASKNDVILVDNNVALNNVVTNELGLTSNNAFSSYYINELYAEDKIHFNTNAYIIMTKNILSNLNFDYSQSQFMMF
ncbi:MAG: SGNH/GDSL hydrolase family protein [Malacoplasma sp.]|nr:SGNH/GDSL hydrolase family protein [Malacoplasma sp.]